MRRRAFSSLSSKSVTHLSVPNAALLLNAIATQYERMERVLIEFVDNSIDAADESTNTNKHTRIHVDIDHKTRSLWIRDNGPGFQEEKLINVVGGVGTSSKLRNKSLNGRFGFGMQSFRGAAKRMHVVTKTRDMSDPMVLSVDRDRLEMPSPSILTSAFSKIQDAENRVFESKRWLEKDHIEEGTAIMLDNIDPMWWKTLNLKSVKREIESHFEVLLSKRRDISIEVSEIARNGTRESSVCEAFSYDELSGTKIARTIDVGENTTLDVNLNVGTSMIPQKKARFFLNGRRIDEVGKIRSFAEFSSSPTWDHPGVCGFVEISGDTNLEPVLTRTDFAKSAVRERVYEGLSSMESEISVALNEAIEEHTDNSLGELESVLAAALRGVERDNNQVLRRRRRVDDDDEETMEMIPRPRKDVTVDGVKYKSLSTKRTRRSSSTPGFAIQFVRATPDVTSENLQSSTDEEEDSTMRSFRASDTIYVNVNHPHFTRRLRRDKSGRLQFDARLCAYLATEVATQFHSSQDSDENVSKEQLYHVLNDSVNNLEYRLFKKMNGLKKRLRSNDREGIGNLLMSSSS